MRTKFSKDKLETLHKPAPSRTNAPMEISRPWERSQVESVAAGELLLFGANLYLLSLYNCVFLSLRFFFSYSQHARLGQICSSARTCSKIIKQNWRLLQNLTLSLHIPPAASEACRRLGRLTVPLPELVEAGDLLRLEGPGLLVVPLRDDDAILV